jgi:hypothetical protein
MVGRLMHWSFVFDISVKLVQNLLKFQREIWHLPSLATVSSDPLSYITVREGHAEIAVDLIMHAVKLEGLTDGIRAAPIYR